MLTTAEDKAISKNQFESHASKETFPSEDGRLSAPYSNNISLLNNGQKKTTTPLSKKEEYRLRALKKMARLPKCQQPSNKKLRASLAALKIEPTAASVGPIKKVIRSTNVNSKTGVSKSSTIKVIQPRINYVTSNQSSVNDATVNQKQINKELSDLSDQEIVEKFWNFNHTPGSNIFQKKVLHDSKRFTLHPNSSLKALPPYHCNAPWVGNGNSIRKERQFLNRLFKRVQESRSILINTPKPASFLPDNHQNLDEPGINKSNADYEMNLNLDLQQNKASEKIVVVDKLKQELKDQNDKEIVADSNKSTKCKDEQNGSRLVFDFTLATITNSLGSAFNNKTTESNSAITEVNATSLSVSSNTNHLSNSTRTTFTVIDSTGLSITPMQGAKKIAHKNEAVFNVEPSGNKSSTELHEPKQEKLEVNSLPIAKKDLEKPDNGVIKVLNNLEKSSTAPEQQQKTSDSALQNVKEIGWFKPLIASVTVTGLKNCAMCGCRKLQHNKERASAKKRQKMSKTASLDHSISVQPQTNLLFDCCDALNKPSLGVNEAWVPRANNNEISSEEINHDITTDDTEYCLPMSGSKRNYENSLRSRSFKSTTLKGKPQKKRRRKKSKDKDKNYPKVYARLTENISTPLWKHNLRSSARKAPDRVLPKFNDSILTHKKLARSVARKTKNFLTKSNEVVTTLIATKTTTSKKFALANFVLNNPAKKRLQYFSDENSLSSDDTRSKKKFKSKRGAKKSLFVSSDDADESLMSESGFGSSSPVAVSRKKKLRSSRGPMKPKHRSLIAEHETSKDLSNRQHPSSKQFPSQNTCDEIETIRSDPRITMPSKFPDTPSSVGSTTPFVDNNVARSPIITSPSVNSAANSDANSQIDDVFNESYFMNETPALPPLPPPPKTLQLQVTLSEPLSNFVIPSLKKRVKRRPNVLRMSSDLPKLTVKKDTASDNDAKLEAGPPPAKVAKIESSNNSGSDEDEVIIISDDSDTEESSPIARSAHESTGSILASSASVLQTTEDIPMANFNAVSDHQRPDSDNVSTENVAEMVLETSNTSPAGNVASEVVGNIPTNKISSNVDTCQYVATDDAVSNTQDSVDFNLKSNDDHLDDLNKICNVQDADQASITIDVAKNNEESAVITTSENDDTAETKIIKGSASPAPSVDLIEEKTISTGQTTAGNPMISNDTQQGSVSQENQQRSVTPDNQPGSVTATTLNSDELSTSSNSISTSTELDQQSQQNAASPATADVASSSAVDTVTRPRAQSQGSYFASASSSDYAGIAGYDDCTLPLRKQMRLRAEAASNPQLNNSQAVASAEETSHTSNNQGGAPNDDETPQDNQLEGTSQQLCLNVAVQGGQTTDVQGGLNVSTPQQCELNVNNQHQENSPYPSQEMGQLVELFEDNLNITTFDINEEVPQVPHDDVVEAPNLVADPVLQQYERHLHQLIRELQHEVANRSNPIWSNERARLEDIFPPEDADYSSDGVNSNSSV